VGDRPQGVAGDCNSLAETHAWFDSRVAHQIYKNSNKINALPPILRADLDISMG